jgi:hypothetical protein
MIDFELLRAEVARHPFRFRRAGPKTQSSPVSEVGPRILSRTECVCRAGRSPNRATETHTNAPR